ncbi:MAG: GntR family transcriptional regulator [Planctomycetota bacterium]
MSAATWFRVEPTSGVPIYRQLMEQVLSLRASGRCAPGTLLPSVRQMAEDLSVNPMTVSKAWSLLERDGVVELVRGQGMRVLAPASRSSPAQRLGELQPLLNQVAAHAHRLALPPATVIDALKKALSENTHD